MVLWLLKDILKDWFVEGKSSEEGEAESGDSIWEGQFLLNYQKAYWMVREATFPSVY